MTETVRTYCSLCGVGCPSISQHRGIAALRRRSPPPTVATLCRIQPIEAG